MTRWLFLAFACLVPPLALLLSAQWPLRELVQAYAREANDAGQVLFALAMALGVTQATRAGAHLVGSHGLRSPRFVAIGTAACLLPWALFMLWTCTGPVWAAIVTGEKFAETFNPGYFLVKLALWLLVAAVLAQSVADWWRTRLNDA